MFIQKVNNYRIKLFIYVIYDKIIVINKFKDFKAVNTTR